MDTCSYGSDHLAHVFGLIWPSFDSILESVLFNVSLNMTAKCVVKFFLVFLQPEWYLTQVLSWVRDHWDFLDRNIQPLLDEAGRRDVCAKVGLNLASFYWLSAL